MSPGASVFWSETRFKIFGPHLTTLYLRYQADNAALNSLLMIGRVIFSCIAMVLVRDRRFLQG